MVRAGLILEFTGGFDLYEVPKSSKELAIDTTSLGIDEMAQQILLKRSTTGICARQQNAGALRRLLTGAMR